MELTSAPDTRPTLGLLLAQSRVLNALARGATLEGTPDEIVQQLGVGSDAFRAALQDLVEGGWIFASTTRDGRLVVGRERRRDRVGGPGLVERRAPASRWEGRAASLSL